MAKAKQDGQNNKQKNKNSNSKNRIGKPQKGRKHKKLKSFDSAYTAEWGIRNTRDNKKSGAKFDSRPKSLEQEESRSFKKFLERVNNPFPKRKKKQRNEEDTGEYGMERPVKPLELKQGPKENDDEFVRRIDQSIKDSLHQCKIDDEFGTESDKKFEKELGTKDKNITEPVVNKRKEKNKEKAKEKKQNVKERKSEKQLVKKHGDFHHLTDKVEFGERVDAPPDITAKPKKSQLADLKMLGSKKLLLHDILAKNTNNTTTNKQSLLDREIGKTVKRKNLSAIDKIKSDHEQAKAIALYRSLKAKKQKINFPT